MHKYYLLIGLAIFVSNTAIADSQIRQDRRIISGSISYSKSDYEFDYSNGNSSDRSSKYLSLSPGILYFIESNLAVGGRISYSRSSDDFWVYKTYQISPTIRYYLTREESKLFVEFGYGFGKSKQEYKDSGNSVKSDAKSSVFRIGADYFIAPNVALEPSISYLRRDTDADQSGTTVVTGDSKQTTLAIGMGITVFID